MATLTAAEITNLETARASLISAMATHAAGDPFTHSYTIGGRSKQVTSIEEAMRAVKQINEIIDMANADSGAYARTSFSRHRRFD